MVPRIDLYPAGLDLGMIGGAANEKEIKAEPKRFFSLNKDSQS